MDQEPLDALLTEIALAKETSIPAATWRQWRKKGEGPPYVKLNEAQQGGVRYRRGDVAKWLDERLVQPTKPLAPEDDPWHDVQTPEDLNT